jgi:hypothetical protein
MSRLHSQQWQGLTPSAHALYCTLSVNAWCRRSWHSQRLKLALVMPPAIVEIGSHCTGLKRDPQHTLPNLVQYAHSSSPIVSWGTSA